MPSVLMNIARSCLSYWSFCECGGPFFVCPYHTFKPRLWKRQPKLACRLPGKLVARRKNLDFMRFESFPLEILSQNFPHCSHTEVKSVGSFSHMTSIIFREKVFHSLHCFHGKRFFSFCLSGVNGTVIFQSLHHSGERLCMWYFSGILRVVHISEASSDFRWTFSFSKLPCNVSEFFFCKRGILHFEAGIFIFRFRNVNVLFHRESYSYGGCVSRLRWEY